MAQLNAKLEQLQIQIDTARQQDAVDDVILLPLRYRTWQGRRVKVILVSEEPPESSTASRSALDILAQTPKHRLFKNADEVDQYVRSERDQWDS
jgi:hypothetical protein